MAGIRFIAAVLGVLALVIGAAQAADQRPSLILTAEGVDEIRASEGSYPLFDKAFAEAKARVERGVREGVIVPVPKDPGGGYTHERHKENYKLIHDAGVLYQLTGDERYLVHARALLLAYADIYNGLPLHPARKNQAPGKLFWQSLNESVWLVYAIQGFDAIADALSESDRDRIENDLLRPAAEFLSTENAATFRRIHNHGAWAAAAVGMTGYALRDQELVDRALLGLDGGGTSGFLAQLDQLFSPDGYYTEGPYYQRYALMPFILFAQAIENNQPERKIFEYRNRILLKAIDATIQQSYAGKFFPINDAIKEKGLDTPELIYAVATAYDLTKRYDLLSIAQYQGKTVLTGGGLAVAKAAAAKTPPPFKFKSMVLRDGPDGDQGGLAILRMGQGELAQTLVAKNTGQGFGHGHFDKLSYVFYDSGHEILNDYGAARFLNVPTKDGGRYLPENQSWAKQSVAHNTLVVNETSQFGGDWRESQKHWAEIIYFQPGETMNVVSARLKDAYPSTTITRTLLQLQHDTLAAPVVVDLVRGRSGQPARYDLPFYFEGQLVDFKGKLEANTRRRHPLGNENGYQHLWVEARGRADDDIQRISWLKNRRFYTLHSATPAKTEVVFVRTGANDPSFNLRSEQGVILRAPKQREAVFVSVIEPHGVYDPAAEFTSGSEPQIASIDHVSQDGRDFISLHTVSGETIHIAISNDPDPARNHHAIIGGGAKSWTGFAAILEEQ